MKERDESITRTNSSSGTFSIAVVCFAPLIYSISWKQIERVMGLLSWPHSRYRMSRDYKQKWMHARPLGMACYGDYHHIFKAFLGYNANLAKCRLGLS